MTAIATRIKELADEQRKAWETEGKPLADIASERALTADEREKFERLERAYNEFDDRITLLSQQRDLEQRAADFAGDLLGNRSAFGNAVDVKRFADEIRGVLNGENRDRFTDYVPSAAEVRAIMSGEARALSVGVAAAGGNAVGKTYLQQLLEPLRQFSGLYAAGAYTLVTEKGEDVILPRLASFGSAASTAELVQVGGTDPSFNQVTFGTKRFGQFVGISNDLVVDSLVDIEGLTARLIGENISAALGQDLATGTGTAAPHGIANATTAGVTGATGAGGAPTWENLIDLQESVLAPYHANAAWVLSNSAVASVRKMKDSSGRYLWEPNGQTGTASQLLGAPVHRDPFIAGVGLGAKSIFFGDFSRYWIRLVGNTRVERSDHALFGSDQVAFRGVLRADGRLMDASAVKHFIGGAS
ncbi:HK97 family phage major capsid protein [Microbacterium marinum]|uniref:HK97 family phage major capsid protein n=1 Tax=Microbacterium marinum TaxID=421115 RepID=A0A7W7BSD7_9MICO|nr:phage major capsid protein [Microbacterium marinum]MBB4666976.1 HK97 family phage major capsid protein [Microbacterium marinum]